MKNTPSQVIDTRIAGGEGYTVDERLLFRLGLVAYKRPMRVVGAVRQESFIVALGDRRVCRF